MDKKQNKIFQIKYLKNLFMKVLQNKSKKRIKKLVLAFQILQRKMKWELAINWFHLVLDLVVPTLIRWKIQVNNTSFLKKRLKYCHKVKKSNKVQKKLIQILNKSNRFLKALTLSYKEANRFQKERIQI